MTYSLKKVSKLGNVLIHSLCDLTIGKDFIKEKVENIENEKIALSNQISELGEYSKKLTSKKLEMLEKLKKFSKFISKGKCEASSL